MSSLLIRNGTIVTATDNYSADVYIAGETIHTIGKNLKVDCDAVIDASDCYLFPGGIDPHTHMEMPFMGTTSSDTYETGTLAALHGGTTTIIDYAIQTRGDSLASALNRWSERAQGKSVGDYSFHMAVTDVNEKTKAEVSDIIEKRGVTSFKVFMAYKGALMSDDRQMLELMKEAKRHGGFVAVHAENGDMIDHLVQENLKAGNTAPKYHALSRPEIVDDEATGRVIDLAHLADHPIYIVHMNSQAGLNRVRQATLRNQKVLCETCPQYLLLDSDLYDRGFEGSKWVMSPTLRKQKDREALWQGINQNLIHVVGTDHCPFNMAQKKMGESSFAKIPNGAPGVENRIELLYSEGVEKGRISINKFVEVTSTNAAKIFGIFPKKGTIAVGSDADIVIFDPKTTHTLSAKTHHMNCDYSAYEGWKVTGKCRTTVLRGTVAIDQGKALIGKGFGKLIQRGKFDRLY